jgi:hypothetical protein
MDRFPLFSHAEVLLGRFLVGTFRLPACCSKRPEENSGSMNPDKTRKLSVSFQGSFRFLRMVALIDSIEASAEQPHPWNV